MPRFVLLGVFIASLVIFPAQAEPTSQDLQFWAPVTLSVPLTAKIRGSVELQARLDDNLSRVDRVLAGPVLSYQLNDYISLAQGYTVRPKFHPAVTTEHRPWQQIQMNHALSGLLFTHRVRLEERFLQEFENVVFRGRYLLRGTYLLDKKKAWQLVASNEVFVNLNTLSGGPFNGFEQNRSYLGISRHLNRHTTVEGGYMLQYINPRHAAQDQVHHVVLLTLNVQW